MLQGMGISWLHLRKGASISRHYKLSFNYLKAKRHIEAIDICHVVRNDLDYTPYNNECAIYILSSSAVPYMKQVISVN